MSKKERNRNKLETLISVGIDDNDDSCEYSWFHKLMKMVEKSTATILLIKSIVMSLAV